MQKLVIIFTHNPFCDFSSQESLELCLSALNLSDEIAVFFSDKAVLNFSSNTNLDLLLRKNFLAMWKLLELYDCSIYLDQDAVEHYKVALENTTEYNIITASDFLKKWEKPYKLLTF